MGQVKTGIQHLPRPCVARLFGETGGPALDDELATRLGPPAKERARGDNNPRLFMQPPSREAHACRLAICRGGAKPSDTSSLSVSEISYFDASLRFCFGQRMATILPDSKTIVCSSRSESPRSTLRRLLFAFISLMVFSAKCDR
jgi:hypothetical protein